ncbi:MAG: PIN domain-containing protein [Actinomycetota bacterium]|nr:PIN domain-containing protein [Actinomycetota bacterium]
MAALQDWPDRVSAVLAQVEVIRAVRRGSPRALPQATQLLSTLALVRLSDEVLEAAAETEPSELRALDALYLATAMSLGSDLGAFVAYDRQLIAAAEQAGLPTLAPS